MKLFLVAFAAFWLGFVIAGLISAVKSRHDQK